MNNIVADGRRRLLDDPETLAKLEHAVRQVRDEFASQLAHSGFLKRLWIRWRMQRAIDRTVEELAPSDAYYFSISTETEQNKRIQEIDS